MIQSVLWNLRLFKLRCTALAKKVWLRLTHRLPQGPLRLHVGSGGVRLEGWVNIDIEAADGVDLVVDVRQGLPFTGVDAIYAEHFLEHLGADDAVFFLREAHRILAAGGRLRLSTPNLHWVVAINHELAKENPPGESADLHLNRAFYCWGHRFLWSRTTLENALTSCGFQDIRWCGYGESEHEDFRGLEGHVTYPDHEHHQHVLVVEAVRGEWDPARFQSFLDVLAPELLDHTTTDYSRNYWKQAWWRDRIRGPRP